MTKETPSWIYYVTRDSLGGDLSAKCGLWGVKPTRVKHRYRVTWVATDARDPGYIGEYTIKDVLSWFRVYPETDLELIRVEMGVTPKMLVDDKVRRA